MSAQQLWETTMDPRTRVLRRVTRDDASAAEEFFSILIAATAGWVMVGESICRTDRWQRCHRRRTGVDSTGQVLRNRLNDIRIGYW